MFFGIIVELDGGGVVIMRVDVDADIVTGNMICLFGTLVEVLDIRRFVLMIEGEGADIGCMGAAGNFTDFAFGDGQFQNTRGRDLEFDLCVRTALNNILGNDVPVQLVDVVLINASGELGFNLFGTGEHSAGKFNTGVIQALGIVFRRPSLCNRVVILSSL